MTPGVLNSPRDRARRFLMPAASVLRNGAQQMGTVSQPALYPCHHIYVSDGSKAEWQDGTPEHPFGCLDDVLKDAGLRMMCGLLAYDYYHIHLKMESPAVVTDPEGGIQLFNGGGFDFKGHLVIENWSPGERTPLSMAVTSTIVLPNLSDVSDADRHIPLSGSVVNADIAVFRNFRGVLFHGFDANLSFSYGYTGYESDRFGNNTPTSKIRAQFNLAVWKNCPSCGMHQCSGIVTTDVTIGDMPDPYDVVNPEPSPEPEEEEDEEDEGSGGYWGVGSISPGGGGGGEGGWGGSSGFVWPDFIDDDLPVYDEFSLSPVGDIHLAASLVSESPRILTRECRAEITCNARTIFGGIAYAEGFQNCAERYSLLDCVNATSDVRDREYVYTVTVNQDGSSETHSSSLSGGSAAAAYAYGEKGSHTSVLKKGTVSATASAFSSESAKVDTKGTFGPTMATSIGYSGCLDPVKYAPLSVAVSASASCPWDKMSQEVQKDSE